MCITIYLEFEISLDKNVCNEVSKMNDYEFSTRLTFFLKEKGISKMEFYKDYLEEVIEERTYRSYFGKGVNKRYPKKDTAELIAKKLGVEPWLLTPHTKEFEKKLKRRVRMIGITEAKFEEYGFELYDYEQAECDKLKEDHQLFNEILFGNSDRVNKKMRNIILLIVQYYFDLEEPFISESILEIIMQVKYMNEDVKKKFYEYIDLIIVGLYIDTCDEAFLELKYDDLCKRYSLSLEKLDRRNKIYVGNVNVKELEKKVEEKGTGNISFNNLKEILVFISELDVEYVDILLKCILMGDDLLKSIAIIVKPLLLKNQIGIK